MNGLRLRCAAVLSALPRGASRGRCSLTKNGKRIYFYSDILEHMMISFQLLPFKGCRNSDPGLLDWMSHVLEFRQQSIGSTSPVFLMSVGALKPDRKGCD